MNPPRRRGFVAEHGDDAAFRAVPFYDEPRRTTPTGLAGTALGQVALVDAERASAIRLLQFGCY